MTNIFKYIPGPVWAFIVCSTFVQMGFFLGLGGLFAALFITHNFPYVALVGFGVAALAGYIQYYLSKDAVYSYHR